MFTGLIQGLGRLQSNSSGQLTVHTTAEAILHRLAIGDSIAVDGICLTVETILDNGFIVTTSPETLNRSTLGQTVNTPWQANLEPALKVGDRLGGHFVTGHVDGVGSVTEIETSAESWIFSFSAPPPLAKFIVSKGSIAINGVSLTIADVTEQGQQFTVAVIPHSFGLTNLHQLQRGQSINLETDVLGKYVEQLLKHQAAETGNPPADIIDTSYLLKHGYA
ncbi:MAG: riboflavin synthase [Acaryochloridaceae cyanobacterium RL_2_7]|nr:riboflavin synthase [Acaryochloridaceae cyanobacterium RL_2_7]